MRLGARKVRNVNILWTLWVTGKSYMQLFLG